MSGETGLLDVGAGDEEVHPKDAVECHFLVRGGIFDGDVGDEDGCALVDDGIVLARGKDEGIEEEPGRGLLTADAAYRERELPGFGDAIENRGGRLPCPGAVADAKLFWPAAGDHRRRGAGVEEPGTGRSLPIERDDQRWRRRNCFCLWLGPSFPPSRRWGSGRRMDSLQDSDPVRRAGSVLVNRAKDA